MMKYYINYSDQNFKKQQIFALKMAKKCGKFDKVIGYTPDDIDKEFYNTNKSILEKSRGGGYWLWKPYFIYKTLEKLNFGDYLFYSDSGVFFLKNVDSLIDVLKKNNQDVMGFELPLIESQWTKRELFLNMVCNKSQYTSSNHILASFQLIKKTEFSVDFYKNLLGYSCSEINITDKFDASTKQNNDFIEHRHDQSIFSLLYKKYNLRPFKDPSQYGTYPSGYTASATNELEKNKLHTLENGRKFRYFDYEENYKMILFHNRKGHPILSFMKYKVKEFLYKIGVIKDLFI